MICLLVCTPHNTCTSVLLRVCNSPLSLKDVKIELLVCVGGRSAVYKRRWFSFTLCSVFWNSTGFKKTSAPIQCIGSWILLLTMPMVFFTEVKSTEISRNTIVNTREWLKRSSENVNNDYNVRFTANYIAFQDEQSVKIFEEIFHNEFD